jgi:hypothetical protein
MDITTYVLKTKYLEYRNPISKLVAEKRINVISGLRLAISDMSPKASATRPMKPV